MGSLKALNRHSQSSLPLTIKLETLRQTRIVAVAFGEWRHLDGVVDDEGGLDEATLAFLAENLVDKFTFAE